MNEGLDRWLSANVREEIERRFYAKINEQAEFQRLARDPDFMAAPHRHVGLFADHGISHARDVAHQLLDALTKCHGVLIPHRDPQRLAWMQGFGVLLAYFHDIGMVDFSPFGRAMHPEYAAQAVFDPQLDDLITAIWQENSGGLAWHLRQLLDQSPLPQEPIMILRELLSLSIGHSKSKITIDVLNDPGLLREQLITTITTDLKTLYVQQQLSSEQPVEKRETNPQLGRYAHLFPDRAFCWLIDPDPTWQALVADAIDTVRVLRAADALRQRGSILRTSGHYQIFVDQHQGNTVYALPLGEDQLFLLEIPDPISAGEANIASSELEAPGDLRISFHRGSFSAPGGQGRAASSAAVVVNDIYNDVIRSFSRPSVPAGLKPAMEMVILLEQTEDDPSFVRTVRDELFKLNPEMRQCIVLTPSLQGAHPPERERYLAANPLGWGLPSRRELLARLGQSGYPAERIDPQEAFQNVRIATLEAGEVLITAQSPSSFVYLPLGLGLKIIPLGGYHSFYVQPWMLLGMTGVVRGAERNATIVAERSVQVLIIPKATYLDHWHQTLSLAEFQAAITAAMAEATAPTGLLTRLERRLLLQEAPLFKSLNKQALKELASRVKEVQIAAGELVYKQGSFGNSLFLVVQGALRIHKDTLILGKLGPGDLLGEMAVVRPEPHLVSVTASENSTLLRLDQRDLNDLINNNPEVAQGIIDFLAGIIRKRTAKIVELNAELPDVPDSEPF